MKFLRWLFHSFVLSANIGWGILFLLSAYSDHVSPARSLLFAYLGLVFPLLAAGTVAFVFYWLFFGPRKYVAVSLLALLLAWEPLSHYLPVNRRKADIPEENTLKVLSYNIMSFAYKKHTEAEANPILSYLARSGADIICLQEYVEFPQKDYPTRRKIYQALRKYPYRSVYQNGDKTGIAVFSKYPIRKSRQIVYPSETNRSSIHLIDVKGKTLTLVNNHLESFKLTTEDRSRYKDFIKSMDSKHFNDFTGTLRQKLGPAFVIRSRQAEKVAAEIAKAETDYTVVCGDFNDTPISYTHRTILGDLKDAFAESGCGLGISYNENMFWFRIDNIFCSANIRPYNCTVEHVRYSDHYPIWTYLKLQ